MYNIEKRHTAWSNNYYVTGRFRGFTKDLKMDRDSSLRGYGIRLSDGHLVADRTGRSPETFETRTAAQRATRRITA